MVVDRGDDLTWMCLRNVPTCTCIEADQLNTYDVLVADDVVFTKDALDEFLGPARGKGAKAVATEAETEEGA